jgi:AraC family transcriptional regulator
MAGTGQAVELSDVTGVPPMRLASGWPASTAYPPGAVHGPRILDDFEFVWLLSGGATVTSEAERDTLRPGVLYLFGPGHRHSLTWDPSGPSRHGYVHFTPAPGRVAADPPAILARRFTTADPLAAMCRHLSWLGAARPDGWARRVEAIVDCLFETFLEGPLPEALAPTLVTDQVLAFVARAWAEGRMDRISIADLAADACISAGHLERRFRAENGRPLAAVLELIRLARAAGLLAQSALPVPDIAEVTGFGDRTHLSRRFHRIFGMPPAAYRRASGASELPLPADIVRVLPLIDRLSLQPAGSPTGTLA